jgi:hypothetical protein
METVNVVIEMLSFGSLDQIHLVANPLYSHQILCVVELAVVLKSSLTPLPSDHIKRLPLYLKLTLLVLFFISIVATKTKIPETEI